MIIIVVAVVALLAAGLGSAYLILRPDHPSGKLETQPGGISVSTAKPPPPPPIPKPKPKPKPTGPVYAVDKPCWLNFGGDPQRSLARLNINLGVPTKPLWARGLHGYVEYPPSYCDGTLYVNTFKGRTYAIDARTGNVIWVRQGKGPKPSTPAIAGPRLIVSSTDGTVTGFDRKNGHLLWRLSTDAKVESSPLAIDNTAYFGATDGRLFAVDTRTGKVRWAYDTGGRINSSPSIWGNRICITTYAGSIFCLNRLNGHKLWDTYISRDFARDESFYASASTDGRRLFTISRSGKVVALRATNGQTLWTRDLNTTGYSTPPSRTAASSSAASTDNSMPTTRRPDRRSGVRCVGGRILGPARGRRRARFFSTLEQDTYALRVADGRVAWRPRHRQVLARDRDRPALLLHAERDSAAFRGRVQPAEPEVTTSDGWRFSRAATGAGAAGRAPRGDAHPVPRPSGARRERPVQVGGQLVAEFGEQVAGDRLERGHVLGAELLRQSRSPAVGGRGGSAGAASGHVHLARVVEHPGLDEGREGADAAISAAGSATSAS